MLFKINVQFSASLYLEKPTKVVHMIKKKKMNHLCCWQHLPFSADICANIQCNCLLYSGEVLRETKAVVIFVIIQINDFAALGELLLLNNVTEKIWLGLISSTVMKNLHYAHVYDGTIGFDQHQGKIPGFKKFILSLQPQNVKNIKNTKKHTRQTKHFLETGTKQKYYFQKSALLVQTKQLFPDFYENASNPVHAKYNRTQNIR